MYTQNPNIIQMCSRGKINLLFLLLDPIVMQHIFTCLPSMPSMFWCLHKMNKAWFMFVGKSPPWNALEVIRIDHKSFVQQLTSSGTPRQSLQMHFKFELQSLKMCLHPIDLIYPTMYYDSKSDCTSLRVIRTNDWTNCLVRAKIHLFTKYSVTNECLVKGCSTLVGLGSKHWKCPHHESMFTYMSTLLGSKGLKCPTLGALHEVTILEAKFFYSTLYTKIGHHFLRRHDTKFCHQGSKY
jgi:hypothetical protein